MDKTRCVLCGGVIDHSHPISRDIHNNPLPLTVMLKDGKFVTGHLHRSGKVCNDRALVRWTALMDVRQTLCCYADPDLDLAEWTVPLPSWRVDRWYCPIHGTPEAALVYAIRLGREFTK